jgi:hypothetical protein
MIVTRRGQLKRQQQQAERIAAAADREAGDATVGLVAAGIMDMLLGTPPVDAVKSGVELHGALTKRDKAHEEAERIRREREERERKLKLAIGIVAGGAAAAAAAGALVRVRRARNKKRLAEQEEQRTQRTAPALQVVSREPPVIAQAFQSGRIPDADSPETRVSPA